MKTVRFWRNLLPPLLRPNRPPQPRSRDALEELGRSSRDQKQAQHIGK
jgi:hypothetical protein